MSKTKQTRLPDIGSLASDSIANKENSPHLTWNKAIERALYGARFDKATCGEKLFETFKAQVLKELDQLGHTKKRARPSRMVSWLLSHEFRTFEKIRKSPELEEYVRIASDRENIPYHYLQDSFIS